MIRLLVALIQFLQKLTLLASASKSEKFLSDEIPEKNPFRLFEIWYNHAKNSGILLYESMALSTSTPGGKPSCRMVLLKGCDENGFVFFTNYNSRKSKEIIDNSYAALTFYWNMFGRQVRIEGMLERVPENESEEYFRTRPRGSQIGAWASEQSSAIPDRKTLVESVKKFETEFKGKDVPRPPHWGGYLLKPASIEFWQAQPSRLHDRILFTLQNDKSWKIVRLAP